MKKQINECSCGCGGDQDNGHYMFMSNLKTMRKHIDSMLQMDPQQVEQLLNNGHDWAADHIATSKDDIEEVAGFLSNEMGSTMMPSRNHLQTQFVPVTLDSPDSMKNFIREIVRKVKGGYRLYSHKGKNLGTFDSKAGAEKHEREVNYFKHKK
jgi:hypothetical protein